MMDIPSIITVKELFLTPERKTMKETKRLEQIIKGNDGFSLAELLMATLIMMLATGLLAQTIGLALSQYHKSTQQSEAKILCSTICNFVSGELTYASFRKDASDELITRDGAVVFSDGAHNMGKDAYFMIQTASGMQKVGTTANGVGRLVETSPSYGGPEKSFDVAGGVEGASSYAVSGGSAYDLYAGMCLHMGADHNSVVAEVWVEDKNGVKLSEHKVRILPMELK